MLAVFVNCASVAAGSFIGLLFSKKITDEISANIRTAAGIVTFMLGVQMAMKYHSIVFMTLSLIIGGVIGFLLDVDGRILLLGNMIQKLFYKNGKGRDGTRSFGYAFLNSSVLFCVGAMAIVGSFKAGVEKDYSIIFTKSILDGFMAVSFASAMGVGTVFSVISIFVYQGTLTLLSVYLQPYISDLLIEELTAVGGAAIMMIGINLLGLKNIKTANFLPALVLEAIFVLFSQYLKVFP